MTEPKSTRISASRREFLISSSAAAAASATAFSFLPNAHAAANDTIKVGVIGAGGRGTGAAENICEAAGSTYNIKIHAIGDAFEDRANNCYEALKGGAQSKDKFSVDKERVFHGFGMMGNDWKKNARWTIWLCAALLPVSNRCGGRIRSAQQTGLG